MKLHEEDTTLVQQHQQMSGDLTLPRHHTTVD